MDLTVSEERAVALQESIFFSAEGSACKVFLDIQRVDKIVEVPGHPSSPGSLDGPGSMHPLLKADASVASSEGRQVLQQVHEEGAERLAE